MLILLHHTILLSLEVFSFAGFFQTLLRIFLSSVATLVLAVVAQVLFYKPDKT
jgi:hypothetical protein